ncbi:hypothetical protein C8J35_1065 [Rhizobium sp. PP-F2F-G38]|nr:hypothetical protein C8J35_1065 [Rhizobium sp. PP-F2F-G38]
MASDDNKRGSRHAGGKSVPKIGLAGDLLHRVDIVKSTTMSLLVSPGSIEDSEQEVLVPFVTLDFKGSGQIEDDEVEDTFFSRILTLDNAAYVASDLMGELNEALAALVGMSQGNMKPEPQRLKAASTFLTTAQDRAADCLRLLAKLSGPTSSKEPPDSAIRRKGSTRSTATQTPVEE